MTTARITARAATRSAPNRPLLGRTMPRAHSVGRWGEELTASILEANGYRILERNWRPPAGLEHEQIDRCVDKVLQRIRHASRLSTF